MAKANYDQIHTPRHVYNPKLDVFDGADDPATKAFVTTAIATHAGAADPHSGYQKESEKSQASGYASLDAGTKVPTAELGGAGADNTKFLRGDQTWAAPTASVAATTIEEDLGSTPTWRGRFTITDAAIGAASKVLCWQAPGPYTGKGARADEAEMAPIHVISVEPDDGVATVTWETLPVYVHAHVYAGGGGQSPTLAHMARAVEGVPSAPRRRNKVRGNVKFTYFVLA